MATMGEQRILHLDMDAFYASVEALDRPELAGKPVLVGGSGPRSVVAACSYEARRFGVRSAMPMRRALELCPDAVLIRPRMKRYAEISAEIFAWLGQEVERVEKTSIDEGYLDLGALASDEEALAFGRRVKEEVRGRFGLVCSVGIAPCKFIAKIASDLEKPDALVLVRSGQTQAFLDPLDVGKIPGVGKVGRKKLHAIGVRTIADLGERPREALARMFGKWGARLYDFARGIDPRPLVTHRERKSLGTERTFPQDVEDAEVLSEALDAQSEKLGALLRDKGFWVRTVTVKVRYSDFQTATRQESFAHPIQGGGDIAQVAGRLLERTEARSRPLRLIGVSVSGFSASADTGELPLFDGS